MMRDRYPELCVDEETRRNVYGITNRDVSKVESGDNNSAASDRYRRMCKDCPVILDCYDQAIRFIENDLKILGVWAAYPVDEISRHVRGDSHGKHVTDSVRTRLTQRQAINRERFDSKQRTV